ncbi:exopolysaccharide biosynthesis polyprenyl glycosylphosphotransferase [Persicobacter psychrovividus]|uniref:Undecaprenyl-phosphate glucose phosphotransferase n=1 Tax=Persicobacter psychrovividus TaxID=387638 RepID=A0ABM7VGC3_9BACT|nr:undecaprenyl-phosphate glucose phosphotransferase [Persicobacter psychrovividus]
MRYGKYLKEVKLLGDLIALNVFYFLGQFLFETFVSSEAFPHRSMKVLLLIYNFAWLFSSSFLEIHETARSLQLERVFSRLLNALTIFLLAIFGVYGLSLVSLPPQYVCVTYLASSFGIIGFHMGFIVFLKFYRRAGYNIKNIVLLGDAEVTSDLKQIIFSRADLGFKVKGIFDREILADLEKFFDFLIVNEIQEVFCHPGHIEPEVLERLVEFTDDNIITLKIVPDFRGYIFKGMDVQLYGHVPVLKLKPHPFDNPMNQWLKRAFDIGFSLFFLIFIGAWLFPLMALLIRLESKGPVFFKQPRGGEGNKPFKVWKFRSMRVHDDKKVVQATKGDPRITKIGAFIRKTSIDELPQFINVLKGEMSVVGPRPHAVQHNEEYRPLIEKFNQRHKVKPGITGLAQAKGYRGETETVKMMADRVKMDRFYVENWSFWFDVKIIVMTVNSMLNGEEKAY